MSRQYTSKEDQRELKLEELTVEQVKLLLEWKRQYVVENGEIAEWVKPCGRLRILLPFSKFSYDADDWTLRQGFSAEGYQDWKNEREQVTQLELPQQADVLQKVLDILTDTQLEIQEVLEEALAQ